MGKAQKKSGKGAGNWPIRARSDFLFQAIQFISNNARLQPPGSAVRQPEEPARDDSPSPSIGSLSIEPPAESEPKPEPAPAPLDVALSAHLSAHLRIISQKAQVRLPLEKKRALCKHCGCLQTHRDASLSTENLSKDGKKDWADALVLRCDLCGTQKRFPVGNGVQKNRRRGRAPGLSKRAIKAALKKEQTAANRKKNNAGKKKQDQQLATK